MSSILRTVLIVVAIAAVVIVALIVALLLWHSSGPTYPTPGQVCPASAAPPSPDLACDEAQPARNDMPRNDMPRNDMPRNDMPRNDMPRNDMPRNDMPRNGLSASSLATNRELLSLLARSPLTASTLQTASDRGLLEQPYARDLVEYIVSCALDACDTIDAADASWSGGLGVCGRQYAAWAARGGATDEPAWRAGPPTPACLERVSACVLARVNALGSRVMISMRGDGLDAIERVPVDTQFRENHGTPIRSFESCAARCLWGHKLRRNCDWSPRWVGQCESHPDPAQRAQVTLRVAAGHARVRVCAGLYGCDDPSPFAGGMTDGVRRSYAPGMIGFGRDAVTFACPPNGPEIAGRRVGYYSVMLAPAAPGDALPVSVDVIADVGDYPAEEAAVFTYREGAFFGSLFTRSPAVAADAPAIVAPATCSAASMLGGDQHACFGEMWTQPAAYATHRLCAGTTDEFPGGCFANLPGPCAEAPDARCRDIRPPAQLFRLAPTASQGAYHGCAAATAVALAPTQWPRAYTVYLNHPCDLAGDDQACGRMLRDPVAQSLAAPFEPPSFDDNDDGQDDAKGEDDSISF